MRGPNAERLILLGARLAVCHRAARSEIDFLEVVFVGLIPADDMGYDSEHHLAGIVLLIVLPEQILEDRKLGQAGIAAHRLRFGVSQQASKQVDLAIFQAGLVLNVALADLGLAEAANVHRSGDRRDLQRHLQRHFVVGMNIGRDVDIYAYIEVLELSIHRAAKAALERSRGDRHAVADLERRLLAVHHANLGSLNDLGVAVGGQQGEGDAWDGHREVAGMQAGERIERQA